MCGFIGINKKIDKSLLEKISSSLVHRGPDDYGDYLSNTMNLAHRRLSIIDLKKGKQPISNEDRTLWIVFNGEMYNYQEERLILEQKGHLFETESDTEVILHLYEEYGLSALHKIKGQFAIAIWDKKQKKLILARDRFGIKPLYYYYKNNSLIFASEIKAILKFPEVSKQLNLKAVSNYFNLRYNPGEESFFCNIKKLPAGAYAIFNNNELKIKKYYTISFSSQPKTKIPFKEVEEKISALLADSVKYRLISDVEVGLFLSSGIDSASILSLVSQFTSNIKVFSIGFGSALDETQKAQNIAKAYQADFYSLRIKSQDCNLLPEIVQKFDEPIGDSIIIPSYLLSKFASEKVKVVLTGEGADEIFGGYIHQLTLFYLEKYFKGIPKALLRLISKAIKVMPLKVLNLFFPYPDNLGKVERDKIVKFLQFAYNFYLTRRHMISLFGSAEFAGQALKPLMNNEPDVFKENAGDNNENFFFKELDLSLKTWLTDYTLYKQDTLTMANSQEGRVPFLDHRLVEFLTKLPLNYFIKWTKSKMPLRYGMQKKLPDSVVNTRKQPFYFPYQKFADNNFGDLVKEIHNHSRKNSALNDILNFHFFAKMLNQNLSKLSLLDSKQLMTYIIFLIWYQYHFKN